MDKGNRKQNQKTNSLSTVSKSMSSLDIKSIRQKEEQLITQVSQDEDLITQVPDHRQTNTYQKTNVRGSSMGGIAPNNGMAKGS